MIRPGRRRQPWPGSPPRQAGVALLTVLWLLALVTVMAGSYSYLVRTEVLLAKQQRELVQARALAEAGVSLALLEITLPERDRRWQADGRVYRLGLTDTGIADLREDEPADNPRGEVDLRLVNAAGFLDLNQAPRTLLLHFLTYLEMPAEQREALADAILDWRDQDPFIRTRGAEDPEYRRAQLPYGAKDGPFEHLEELAQVYGMSTRWYEALLPYLTVYSQQPGINPTFAPENLLLFLAAGDEERVSNWLEEREKTGSGEAGLVPGTPTGADPSFISGGQSDVYHLFVEGRAPGGGVATLEVVAKRDLQDSRGYTILNWREGRLRILDRGEKGA